MHLEANAVSQAMAEAIAMTGCGNQLASNAVEGLPANPGGNGVERTRLRIPISRRTTMKIARPANAVDTSP